MRSVFQQFGLVIHVSRHKEYPEWRWYKMFLKWHLMKKNPCIYLEEADVGCRMQMWLNVRCVTLPYIYVKL